MKKIKAFFIYMIFASNLFAVGAGLQAGFRPSFLLDSKAKQIEEKPIFLGFGGNVSGTLKLDRIPVILATGINLSSEKDIFTVGINASCDFYYENQIFNTLNFSTGIGPSLDILYSQDSVLQINPGFRFFAGLNKYFLDGYIEIFARQIINPVYRLDPINKKSCFGMDFPFETGLRFHF